MVKLSVRLIRKSPLENRRRMQRPALPACHESSCSGAQWFSSGLDISSWIVERLQASGGQELSGFRTLHRDLSCRVLAVVCGPRKAA